jgi:glutamate carboxypeptidase
MDPTLGWARKQQPALNEFIRQMVECESPSDSPADVNRFVDLFSDAVKDIADCRTIPGDKGAGRILVCSFRLPTPGGKAAAKKGVLALGHSDTVWPLGTLATMPFRKAKGRLWGPGVLDMKAGLAFFVFAMRALRELEIPVPHRVELLVNPDEETGSRLSRLVTEKLARTHKAVLVLEPGTGLEGKAKTARKGIGDYRLQVHGVASHAGVDFEKGASAALELARQVDRIAGFTNLKRGVTVNPGVISGGTRSNVIAAEAATHVDIRVPTLGDFRVLDRKFRGLRPVDKRCKLTLSGGLNRPPMERTKEVVNLYQLARALAFDLGIHLQESSTGGGSDGNFTAALGIPTLDGLGAVGEGAHAAHESILVDRIADRVALLAKLTAAIQ